MLIQIVWKGSHETRSKQNRLNLACELVALCFSQLWVIVCSRKLPFSPKISGKVSNASRYSERGSTQQGPELCYSQGAWRLGNVTAKSVNYVSHRPLSNQQKRIIFSQSRSSKVQIRNRIKTLAIQGHLPPFSSFPWKPCSNLLPIMSIVHSTGPFPEVTWFVTAASGLGCTAWEGCQPDKGSEYLSQISNESKQAFLLHKFGSLRVWACTLRTPQRI